jgi:hypothetical protein
MTGTAHKNKNPRRVPAGGLSLKPHILSGIEVAMHADEKLPVVARRISKASVAESPLPFCASLEFQPGRKWEIVVASAWAEAWEGLSKTTKCRI